MSAALPLEVRIRTLEAQIRGPTSLIDLNQPSSTSNSEEGRRGATRRLRDISEGLERLGGESEGIKRLIEGYAQYLPLLSIPGSAASTEATTSTSTSNEKDSNVPDQHQQSESSVGMSESDLLPDNVKLTMVLESAEDIIAAERVLREVERYKSIGAEGSGELESLIPYRPALIQAIKESQSERAQLDDLRNQVGSLLGRYNDFTSTASDLFLDIHQQIEEIEARVSVVERKRRKELAERY